MVRGEQRQLAVRIGQQQGPSSSVQYVLLCKEDVERKRHKRNPFAESYVQLLQTPLQSREVRIYYANGLKVKQQRGDQPCRLQEHAGEPLEARGGIETATRDVHVRVEVRTQAYVRATVDATSQLIWLHAARESHEADSGEASRRGSQTVSEQGARHRCIHQAAAQGPGRRRPSRQRCRCVRCMHVMLTLQAGGRTGCMCWCRAWDRGHILS